MGYAMGLVYLCVIVLLAFYFILHSCLSTGCLIVISAFGIIVGCLLVYDRGGATGAQLLVADALMYPSLTGLTAVVDGFLFMDGERVVSTACLNLVVYMTD